MNPLLNYLRSPQGKALLQHAVEAAGQHIVEAVTNAGTAGARTQRHAGPRVRQIRQDAHLKQADVLDVRTDNEDPDAP